VARRAASVVLLLVAMACSGEPSKQKVVYVADTAGIVVRIDIAGPGTRYELVDGRVVSSAGARKPGSSSPAVGDLVVSGTQPALWLHGLRAL